MIKYAEKINALEKRLAVLDVQLKTAKQWCQDTQKKLKAIRADQKLQALNAQLLEACKADAFLVELAEQAIASAITPTDILQKKLLEVNAQRLAAIEAAESQP